MESILFLPHIFVVYMHCFEYLYFFYNQCKIIDIVKINKKKHFINQITYFNPKKNLRQRLYARVLPQ